MSDGIFGRVFGSCLRGWWQGTGTNAHKYIDYAPNRKWRYNDKNLMNELTKDQTNTWDVMDLADDEEVNGKIASNSKLQLHDNVFVNPLDEEENNNINKDSDEAVQEISDTTHTITNLVVAGDGGNVSPNSEEATVAVEEDDTIMKEARGDDDESKLVHKDNAANVNKDEVGDRLQPSNS